MSAVQFIRRVATVGMGGGLAQVLTFLTMPVVTRLYPPDDYAGWALLVSVAVLFTAVGTLRYDLAVVLPDRDEDACNLLVLCLLAALAVAGLAALALAFFGLELIGPNFSATLGGWLWTVPLLVIMSALYQSACAWCVRTKEFFAYSLAQFLLPLCTVGLQIGLALLGMGHAGGLIAGTVAGQTMAAVILAAIVAFKDGRRIVGAIGRGRLSANARSYRNYPLYMTPYTIMGALRDRLAYLLLGNYGGKALVGYYGLSARAVSIPNSLVSSAVRPVFFQWAARAGFSGLERHINQVLRTLVVTVVPGWGFFLIAPGHILALVFGEAWRPAGPYAATLSVAAIPLLLGNWLDRGFDVLGRQRLAFIMELAFSGLSLLALAVGVFLFHDLFWAIVLHVIALTMYYWFWLFALYRTAGFDVCAVWRLLGLVCALAAGGIAMACALTATLPFLVAAAGHMLVAGAGAGLYLWGQIRTLRAESAEAS